MRILNRQYRGVGRTTDVLSFPLHEKSPFSKGGSGGIINSKIATIKEKLHYDLPLPLGDIVINLHKAKRQAAEYGLTVNEEFKKLLIHGLLHLIDYDHEKSRYNKKRMEKKEKELLDAIK